MAPAIGSSAIGAVGTVSRPKRDQPLKWHPRGQGPDTELNGFRGGQAAPREPRASAPQAAPREPRASEAASSTAVPKLATHESSNGVAKTFDEQSLTNGGHGQVPTRRRDRPNGSSQSAGSSSTPAAPDGNDEFPVLPGGGVSLHAKTAAAKQEPNHAEDSRQSSSDLLVQELRQLEQRSEQRKNGMSRLRADVRKLQDDAQDAVRHESQIAAQSVSEQAQAHEQAEQLRARHAELQARVEEQSKSAAGHQDKDHQWREELASMEWLLDGAIEQSQEMEKAKGRWRKAHELQNDRLRRAEAKLKSTEVRREDQRAQGKKIQAQAAESLQQGRQLRNEVQEMRKQLNCVDLDITSRRQQWQVASGVLLLMLLLLIFGG